MSLGEIGGNDYNFAFNKGVPRETVRAFVPAVVDKLAAAVEELIGMGARAFVVPGNLPFGCAPLYLNRFRGAAASEYDARTGCLAWFNKFAEFHNRVLTARLDDLRRLHPDVTIVYADWYGAMTSIFQAPGKLGECVRTRQLSLSLSLLILALCRVLSCVLQRRRCTRRRSSSLLVCVVIYAYT